MGNIISFRINSNFDQHLHVDECVQGAPKAKYLLVSWESVMLLLSVCRIGNCGSPVLPDDIKISNEGK